MKFSSCFSLHASWHAVLLCPVLAVCLPSCQTLPEPGAYQRHGTIVLQAATDKPAYRLGELMTCTITPSVDCRLSLLIQRADGRVQTIYPNTHSNTGRIFRSGQPVRFPDSGMYQFRVVGPTGREQLIIRATAATRGATGVPPATSGTWLKSKQIAVEAAGPAAASAWTGEARVIYDVIP